ncbi:Uncharacterized conserved protein, DUF1499 family [Mariprofundus aestuarium]|uniref:Uncharacterized conserved protein, DUF1499 family n=1 Tax=Mariprofundus aestuarium TaxID=1921086 RepID=A0A2K8KWP9_MARES|nr:DUF1499 domain-containing protein [Mariprofundus aestuarium]ATX79325.1 Uncharacterized conserved protein, DUF1499 family [Mariprofundus aestuarium]
MVNDEVAEIMKWLLIIVGVLLVAGLVAFIAMAIQSHKSPESLGLQNGLLRSCPASPNCVCSEEHSQGSEEHAIGPIKANDGGWKRLTTIITEQGGEIQKNDGSYLHATFTTPVFRYVDDVELRLDEGSGLIHIRSASRVGRSDFSVNRNRIERLKKAL